MSLQVRTRTAVIGAGLIALAVIAVVIVNSLRDTDPNIELIETYAAAWYSGDHETSLEILGFDPATSRAAIGWSQYESAVGARVWLDCSQDSSDPAVYACDVTYSNALYEAVDAEPKTIAWLGRVTDETIEVLSFAGDPGEIESSWVGWANELGDHPCNPSRPPTPECAEFQIANLGRWAEWHIDRRE